MDEKPAGKTDLRKLHNPVFVAEYRIRAKKIEIQLVRNGAIFGEPFESSQLASLKQLCEEIPAMLDKFQRMADGKEN